MTIERLAGPSRNVCWTPDAEVDPPDVVLVDSDALVALEESEDRLSAAVGRYAHENSYFQSDARKAYEAQRRLENAIRRHVTGACTCRGPKQCLSQLAKLIPLNPRPKYGSRPKVKVTAK